MNFIILHGTLGNPKDNWFQWLKEELEKIGQTVITPQLPTPEGQNPESWIREINKSVNGLSGNKDLVFIAHSMSPLSVCQYIESNNRKVRACFFISGFASWSSQKDEPYTTLNTPFVNRKIDWEKLKTNCTNIYCFAGDNDPYVPFKELDEFAKLCNAKEFIVVPNGGHLNSEKGYSKFPLLLEKIKSELGL